MSHLPPGAAHVWWAPRSAARPSWQALLDPVERQRRAGYRREEDRDRFLVGAVLTRLVLAAALGIDPVSVRLDRDCPDCDRPHGKVRLAAGQSGDPLEVSISHSGVWVTVAVSQAGPVGVDVERVNPAVDHLGVARIAFGPGELAALTGLAAEARPAAFTRSWTRKEAVVKSVGDGLRTPLRAIEVSAPDQPAAVVAWPTRPELAGGVQLHDLALGGDYRAALAVVSAAPVEVIESDAGSLLARL